MKTRKLVCLALAVMLFCMNLSDTIVYAEETNVPGEESGADADKDDRTTDADGFQIEDGILRKYTGTDADVVIPEGITSIAIRAFADCSSIVNVTIPEGVTDISQAAFAGCSNLKNVNIPQSLTLIGDLAFQYCINLASIEISSNVREIDASAFDGCCKLAEIKVDEENQRYDSRNNCNAIIETESNTLLRGGKDTIIPEGIICIGAFAFSGCEGIMDAAFPEGVKKIDGYAFADCKDLISATIPEGVESIGWGVFSGCSNLENVTLPVSLISMGNRAFNGTKWLENKKAENPLVIEKHILIDGSECSGEVIIPQGVTVIGESAFANAHDLTSVIIPKGVTNIGYRTFVDCGLTSIVIPEGVVSISEQAFWGCSSLVDIAFPSSLMNVESIAFDGTKWLEEKKAENPLVILGHILISGEGSNGDIVIPEGVKVMADHAFGRCSNLTSVTTPESLLRISDHAFADCGSLTSVSISEGLLSIDDYAFVGCGSLVSVEIPEGVTDIGDFAFAGCGSLVSVEIPESVTDIGEYVFDNNRPLCIYGKSGSYAETYAKENNIPFMEGEAREFDIQDGVLTNYYGDATEVVIPEGVTRIGDKAFYNSNLVSVTLPDSVTSIGESAFAECRKLTNINIPDSVTEIGMNAFRWCLSLSNITIPGSVANIGFGAFSMSGLQSIIISEGVKNIGAGVFEECSGLKSVIIPGSVTHINRFSYCALEEIVISEGTTSIAEGAFGSCLKLKSVTIPESVTSIGSGGLFLGRRDSVLKVVKGSYAETYAKENNIKYVYVSGGADLPCDHAWNDVIAKATTKKNGVITKTCTKCGEKSTATIYAPAAIKLSEDNFIYNNKSQKPTVTIKDSKGKVLSSRTDYSVTYPKAAKNVGQYTVAISFKGNYSGTVKESFVIVPKGTSLSKVTPKKKGFTVKWKKQKNQTTGYEIAYATDSKFSKKNTKVVSVDKNGTTSKSIGKLKAKKKYFVRIRTYKTVKGKKYYSGWSKVKKVAVKK